MLRRRVLVFGAQGVLGHFLAQTLHAAGWDVVRSGRRPEEQRSFRHIDLDALAGLEEACAGVDVVVNTVPHPGLGPERAVLRHGGTLLNVAGLTAVERRQLEAEAIGARGLVVVHAGLVPGVVTLAAADLFVRHPDADGGEIAFTFSTASTSGRAGRAFVHRRLAGARRHPTVVLPLPPPFGRQRGLDVGMEEEGWLAALGGARPVRLVACVAERLPRTAILLANRLGLMARLPRAALVGPRRSLPTALSREPVCAWAAVRHGGHLLGAWSIEGAGDYTCTVAATLVLAEALRARHAAEPGLAGVAGPETVFTLAALRPAFEARGLRFTLRTGATQRRDGP